MAMEVVGDWDRWFKDKGVKPIHARRWPRPDEKVSSGAVRTDDGAVWAWSRENGMVEAWRADDDEAWDGSSLVEPDMREARGDKNCLRLLSAEDPWDAETSVVAANTRRDQGLRDVFG